MKQLTEEQAKAFYDNKCYEGMSYIIKDFRDAIERIWDLEKIVVIDAFVDI